MAICGQKTILASRGNLAYQVNIFSIHPFIHSTYSQFSFSTSHHCSPTLAIFTEILKYFGYLDNHRKTQSNSIHMYVRLCISKLKSLSVRLVDGWLNGWLVAVILLTMCLFFFSCWYNL